jgi:flagellin
MAIRIAHNITALTAWRNLGQTNHAISKTMEKLSSGYRINRAADDPAGLVISQKMRSLIAGYDQAVANSEIAVSMVQTAEAALTEIHSLLVNMRMLAVHAANEGANDSTMLQADNNQAIEAINTIDRIATTTQFGTKYLIDGSLMSTGNQVTVDFSVAPSAGGRYGTNAAASSAVFQVGPNANQTITISIAAMTANNLGDVAGGNTLNTLVLDSAANATTAIGTISLAIQSVSNLRSALGAFQAYSLESNLNSLRIASENLQASESVIRDSDMSKEIATFTKQQIMLQAGTSMLAQANMIPQAVLQLLG